MSIVLIDYGAGNLHSAAGAFRRIGREVTVTADPKALLDATHIVLPGVGAFADCMKGLQALPGMIEAMTARVIETGVPFLGICVGMQMLFTRGLEHGDHAGLNWIEGEVRPIEAPGPGRPCLKIPHMGWNDLTIAAPAHPALEGVGTGDHAYFVHSYHAVTKDPAHVLATVDYGTPLTAIVGRDNLLGTQFHPEKSQRTGERILENFLRLT